MKAKWMSRCTSSDAYGTVSDWAMVFVTTVTAILLLITLKSQKEVQNTQNEIFKIESIRFRESIKPVLKFSAFTDKMKPSDESKKVLSIEVTNESNSLALNISKILATNIQTKQVFIVTGLDDRRDHLTKGDNPLLFHFLVDSIEPVSGWVIFSINYQDIAGTKYKQNIICICDTFGIEINPFLPEVVTEEKKELETNEPKELI